MATLQKVKVAQDESGHWYVLPNDLEEDFYNDGEDTHFVDSGKFDDKYGRYRTGGALNLVKLYAEM